MTLSATFILFVLGLWFLLSIICQFVDPVTRTRLTFWDHAGTIPYYRVFDRSVRNLTLYYRSDPEGQWYGFLEARTARLRQTLWNPEALPTKILWAHLRSISEFHNLGLEVPITHVAPQCLFQLLLSETECESYCHIAVLEDGELIYAAESYFRLVP